MNLKANWTIILFFCSFLLVSGQSKEILSKSAMLNADESYEKGQYNECLSYLREAETNLGLTNSRVQYLKVKSLLALGSNSQNNEAIWTKAENELNVFFEVTPENSYVPEKYDEMLLAVSKVKKTIEIINAVNSMLELNERTWSIEMKQKWKVAYQNYISCFPNGINAKIAKAKMDNIIRLERIKSNPDIALGEAMRNNNFLDVKECIENGANPNKIYHTPYGDEYILNIFPTSFTNFEDAYSFLTFLFEHGADPNIYIKDFNCRHYFIEDYLAEYWNPDNEICNQKNIEIVKLFLKHGFKKENLSNGYYNVLNYFRDNHKSYWTLMKFLIEAGADPFKAADICNPQSRSPIEIAKKVGRDELYEFYKTYKK